MKTELARQKKIKRTKSRKGAMVNFFTEMMDRVSARTSLSILAFFGFWNLYAVRVNLSVAIMAMVKRNPQYESSSTCTGIAQASNLSSAINDTSTWTTEGEDKPLTKDTSTDLQYEDGEMLWDEATQGLILGSFYYGYAFTQLPGGRLAELYGTKIVFGLSVLAGGICSLFTPVMSRWDYKALIALRVIQGVLQGATWPSMHVCLSKWIPPVKRGRFVSTVYLATNLSSAFTMPLVGVIIARYGWAGQFYVIGTLPIIWSCFWFTFMHDTPEEHPRISQKELEYLQKTMRESGTKKLSSKSIPWRKIFTSLPVWAIIIYNLGNTWGFMLFLTQLPTYMRNILGFSIQNNGFFSALPFLCRYIGANTSGFVLALLQSKKYLSIVAARRIASVISLWGPAVGILGVSLSGCKVNLVIVLFCLTLFCSGSAASSGLVNQTDIAPNFAGTIVGVDNALSAVISFLVPVVNGLIINDQQTLETWQRVFWLCIPILFFTELFFILFVSGEVQPWNDIDTIEASNDKENKAKQYGVQEDEEDVALASCNQTSEDNSEVHNQSLC